LTGNTEKCTRIGLRRRKESTANYIQKNTASTSSAAEQGTRNHGSGEKRVIGSATPESIPLRMKSGARRTRNAQEKFRELQAHAAAQGSKARWRL
jgi:hypothetical protein